MGASGCSAEEINNNQKLIILQKIKRHFGEKLNNKKFAVWGISFKPRTDDIREAPAIALIEKLVEEGSKVNANDPVAMNNAKNYLSKKSYKIKFFDNYYDTLKDADALILVTEWNEYRKPDFDKMKSLMKSPVIFDGRNIYNPQLLKSKKFVYYGIGKV